MRTFRGYLSISRGSAAVSLALTVGACSGSPSAPTSPAPDNVQTVTVTVTRIAVDGSCDHDSIFESPGDGEFDFTFAVEFSATEVSPILTIARRTMAEGTHTFGNALTFGRNVTRGEGFVLRFSGTEYDGLLGADPSFNRRGSFINYTYQAGQWVPETLRSFRLDGGSQCGATVFFNISSRS